MRTPVPWPAGAAELEFLSSLRGLLAGCCHVAAAAHWQWVPAMGHYGAHVCVMQQDCTWIGQAWMVAIQHSDCIAMSDVGQCGSHLMQTI